MNFNLTSPCKDCPFVEGGTMNQSLNPGRMEGIVQSLCDDKSFSCHKTIDYNGMDDESDGDHRPAHYESFCAGALLYLQKAELETFPVRLARSLGIYDPSKLTGHEKIIKPFPLKGE